MALSTYAQLQAAVAQFLAERSDLTDRIPTFIALAEAQMEREIRSYEMVTRASLTLGARHVSLPSDHLQTIRVYADDKPLETISPDLMAEYRNADDTAREPRFMAFVGNEIELYPTPGENYAGDIQYFQAIPRLSNAQTTNWLLTAHPDAYLYGALFQAGQYLDDNDLLKRSALVYSGAVEAINVSSTRQMYPGPMRIRMKPGRQ